MHAVHLLLQAHRHATYNNAHFGDKTEEIKKATALHRNTWILPYIREAVQALYPCNVCKGKRWNGTGLVYVSYRPELHYSTAPCEACGGYGSELIKEMIEHEQNQ